MYVQAKCNEPVPHGIADDNASNRLTVSVGLAIFVGVYLLLIDRMGIWQGIAVAWFPAGLVSWGVTMMVFRLRKWRQH